MLLLVEFGGTGSVAKIEKENTTATPTNKMRRDPSIAQKLNFRLLAIPYDPSNAAKIPQI